MLALSRFTIPWEISNVNSKNKQQKKQVTTSSLHFKPLFKQLLICIINNLHAVSFYRKVGWEHGGDAIPKRYRPFNTVQWTRCPAFCLVSEYIISTSWDGSAKHVAGRKSINPVRGGGGLGSKRVPSRVSTRIWAIHLISPFHKFMGLLVTHRCHSSVSPQTTPLNPLTPLTQQFSWPFSRLSNGCKESLSLDPDWAQQSSHPSP